MPSWTKDELYLDNSTYESSILAISLLFLFLIGDVNFFFLRLRDFIFDLDLLLLGTLTDLESVELWTPTSDLCFEALLYLLLDFFVVKRLLLLGLKEF